MSNNGRLFQIEVIPKIIDAVGYIGSESNNNDALANSRCADFVGSKLSWGKHAVDAIELTEGEVEYIFVAF
ncbi:protein of unknown function [Cupriavidus taiwanensis]|nr:protein of unknown function [Cupriavidus taiwanensis]